MSEQHDTTDVDPRTIEHPYRYEEVSRPTADGHRYFHGISHAGRRMGLYVADRSGATPASTDDGPLRVLLGESHPVQIRRVGGDTVVLLEVLVVDTGRIARIAVAPADLLYLQETGLVHEVQVDREIEPLARVLARVPFTVVNE